MDHRLLGILGGNAEKYPHNLEDKYPRVLGKILSLWNSPELDAYFVELVVNERADRAGFPDEVVSEILYLSFVHAALHAKDSKKKDPWDTSPEAFSCFAPRVSHEVAKSWIEPKESIKLAIQSYGIPCSPDGFLQAAEAGNSPAVALFLAAEFNTEFRDERGWTPLMQAAFNGREVVVYLLIQHGASVNAVDFCGNTALHWAAFAGHAASAKLLIANKADLNLHSCFGWTPLLQATTHRHLEVVQLLLESGADCNATARNGWTALHKAAAEGYLEIVRSLLRQGADRNIKNHDGDTPLMLASKNQREAVMEILMSASDVGNAS